MTIIQEFGFESGTLDGWTSAGSVSLAANATLSAGPTNNFEVQANESLMAVLTSVNGVSAEEIIAALGLNHNEKADLYSLLSGYSQDRDLQNGAYLARNFYLTAGTKYEVAWQYNSVDYVPWNDGSILSVVSLTNDNLIPVLNGAVGRWTLLGFTNPGTGDYSTGSYGSTGWQLARIQVTQSGYYQIGFSVFNLGDETLDPYFYIDANRGVTTNNGEPVVPAASNKGPAIALNASSTHLVAGETSTITFTLSSDSADFDLSDVSVFGGELSAFSGSGNKYQATFTPLDDSKITGTVSVQSGAFSDSFGYENSDGGEANNKVTLTILTLRPTITISSNKSALKVGETATISFALSESATDFTESDVTVSGGKLSSFAGSGAAYSATFTPTADSTTTASVSVANGKFSDPAGNQNADGADADNSASISVDTVRPTIAVSSDKSVLKAGETATISFVLSESASDFTASDVSYLGGSLSNFSGSGQNYSATFTPAADSTTPASISVASSRFTDSAGNLNADGSDANNSVSISVDTVRPTIAVSSNKAQLIAAGAATISFVLSESATDFTESDVTVSSGTLSGFTGSGAAYTATFIPAPNSSESANVSVPNDSFSDDADNRNADEADSDNAVSMTVMTVQPTVNVISNRASLLTGEVAKLTFNLSEDSLDFTASDLSVSGGTLSGFFGSGKTYYAYFTLLSAQNAGKVSVASNKFSNATGNFNLDGAEENNSVTIAGERLFGTSRNDFGRALAVAPDGSMYMAGETEGSLDGHSGAGMRDIFLIKMDPEGSALWTKVVGTRLVDEVTHLDVATDGSVYVSAMSQASLNGAGNSGSHDAYLLKYDPDGDLLWTVRQGTSRIDRGFSVATDSAGAVFLVGQTDGKLDAQRSNGSFDGFITKFSDGGVKLWTRVVGTVGIDAIKDVVTDDSGNVYVTGSLSGTLSGYKRIGGTDAFITKYASDGTTIWTRVFGTKTTDYAESIGLGSDGSIYVAGQTLGSMHGPNKGSYDVFLTKFSSSGTQLWSRQFGSGKADNALDLVVGENGSVFVTGNSGMTILGESSFGLKDSFFAHFQPDGTLVELDVIGTPKDDFGTALAEGLDGVIYMAGYTMGTDLMGKASNGAADAYLFAKPRSATVSNTSNVVVATASPDLFSFAPGSYNATVNGGFAYGDKLLFPPSMSNLSVSNISFIDAQILITASGSGQQIQVALTGVAPGLDAEVTTLDSFWATFGPTVI